MKHLNTELKSFFFFLISECFPGKKKQMANITKAELNLCEILLPYDWNLKLLSFILPLETEIEQKTETETKGSVKCPTTVMDGQEIVSKGYSCMILDKLRNTNLFQIEIMIFLQLQTTKQNNM